MTRGRAARLVAAAAVLLSAGVGLASVPDARATPTDRGTAVRATDGVGIMPVTLLSMTPAVPSTSDTLVITGRVTNTAATPARQVAVRLRISPTPVRTRSEIGDIVGGSAGRTGIAVDGTRVELAPALAPGASVPFTIAVPVVALHLPATTDELVVLVVESMADLDNDGQGLIQTGLSRAFLPWFPVPRQVLPTPVVWLFPLTSAPSRTATGVFLDDHLAAEVAPRGRLSRLLDAAEAAPGAVSWVVDPALLQSLELMTHGYSVRRGDGTSVPGTGSADAAAWLARLRALTATAEVTASAYGDPDVVALHRAGLDVDVALATTTARDVPGRLLSAPVGSGLAWPADGLTDEGTLDVLRASGARAVVLSGTMLPPPPTLTYTPSGSVDLAGGGSPLRAVVADPVLSRLVGAPLRGQPDPGTADVVVRRQTALAELAMTTLELPRRPRTLVIAPDTRWSAYAGATHDLVAAVAASPFATPSRLGTLLAMPPSDVPRVREDYPASARAAELRPAILAAVSAARHELAGLRAVAPDTTDTTSADLEAALTRTESSAWRTDPSPGRHLLIVTRTEIDAQVARVHVLSRAPVTLPGDSGVIPVTVANDLDRPARVGIRLRGTPVTRFVATDVAPVTIGPGVKSTFEVRARVIGTGPVTVDITLTTPDGQAFGGPVQTQVRSAAYARAAQWVVVGLFGVLVVLLGANFVHRRRGGASGDAAPLPADGTGDGPTTAGVGHE